MSITPTSLEITNNIYQLIPKTKIYYKLSDLLTNILASNNTKTSIVIAVEYKNQKRYFLTVSFQELSILLHFLEPPKQTFNEVLCQNNFCKLYFDVDIYIEKSLNLNITESLFILQSLFHCIIFNCTNHDAAPNSSFTDHFLVLSASTELKHSYHLIYTNTSTRFESQVTILQFINTILHNCLQFLLLHSCQQQTQQTNKINIEKDLNDYLVQLQIVLQNRNLCNCIIPKTNITSQDFLKLLYKSIFSL